MADIGRYRWLIGLAILVLLLLAVSGCGGPVQATSWTGLAAVGDKLYAADLEQIQVLDAATGESYWAYPKDPKNAGRGTFYVAPAVDDEYVVVASQAPGSGFFAKPKHVVWALDLEGREAWSFSGASGQYVEGGAIGGSTFVIGNSDGSVYALNLDTGELEWEFTTGHRVWATPLIVSDVVYVGSMDRHLYALSLSDGKVIWDFQSGGAFAGTPALAGGVLYLGAFDDKLYAIDAETGAERWHFSGENWFWGGPAVRGGRVYAADVKGYVYALDAATGQQVWQQVLLTEKRENVPVRAAVALTEDGSQLFVAAQDGTLYALDTADGRKLWSSANEAQLYSDPVVSGTVVFQPLLSGAYRIRAYRVENGREVWSYPVQVEETK